MSLLHYKEKRQNFSKLCKNSVFQKSIFYFFCLFQQKHTILTYHTIIVQLFSLAYFAYEYLGLSYEWHYLW